MLLVKAQNPGWTSVHFSAATLYKGSNDLRHWATNTDLWADRRYPMTGLTRKKERTMSQNKRILDLLMGSSAFWKLDPLRCSVAAAATGDLREQAMVLAAGYRQQASGTSVTPWLR